MERSRFCSSRSRASISRWYKSNARRLQPPYAGRLGGSLYLRQVCGVGKRSCDSLFVKLHNSRRRRHVDPGQPGRRKFPLQLHLQNVPKYKPLINSCIRYRRQFRSAHVHPISLEPTGENLQFLSPIRVPAEGERHSRDFKEEHQ